MTDGLTSNEWTTKTLFIHLTQRFADAEKAVAIAQANATKWQENANEWRNAMNDRERHFVTREVHDLLRADYDRLHGQIAVLHGRGQGVGILWTAIVGAGAIIAVLLSMLTYFGMRW